MRTPRPLSWMIVTCALIAACSVTLGNDAPMGAAGSTAVEEGPLTTLPPVGAITGPAPSASAEEDASSTSTSTTTVAPGGVGARHGEVDGLTMFRGNPSRTWYGEGPLPDSLAVRWRFPDSQMCGTSPVGGENIVWCGSGWTGQPVVWERPDGITEVIFGAYDKNIHFLDAATGERTRPDFPMGDIIKGSVTLDPDGYPLLYSGSRDSRFRIIALDRDEPTELWSLEASAVPGMWNSDWDSNPVIVDGVMYQGGENSWWYAVALNRDYGEDGLVAIEPDIVFDMPAFTDELVAAVGRQQSVESSTAVHEGTAYFTNSAGRIVGVDVASLPAGEASVVFDYWVGDDVDATPVVDAAGHLYVSAEVDLATSRAAEVGQLVKLDPGNPGDPRIWGLDVPGSGGLAGGIWATPALVGDVLFVATNPGELLAVDTETGEVLWRDDIGTHAWSSPVHVDGRLLVSVHCESAPALRIYDVSSDPRAPVHISDNVFAGGCVESTPAVWKGGVYVGSRDGYFYALEAG